MRNNMTKMTKSSKATKMTMTTRKKKNPAKNPKRKENDHNPFFITIIIITLSFTYLNFPIITYDPTLLSNLIWI